MSPGIRWVDEQQMLAESQEREAARSAAIVQANADIASGTRARNEARAAASSARRRLAQLHAEDARRLGAVREVLTTLAGVPAEPAAVDRARARVVDAAQCGRLDAAAVGGLALVFALGRADFVELVDRAVSTFPVAPAETTVLGDRFSVRTGEEVAADVAAQRATLGRALEAERRASAAIDAANRVLSDQRATASEVV